MIRIFLAGEGRHELGSRAGDPVYQSDAQPGVVETLLRKIRADGWEIAGAIQWKDIRKIRPGEFRSAEQRNVMGAALAASERDCHALVFVRNRDTDPDREREVESGIEAAIADFPVAGEVAVEKIEAWIRALAGETGSEAHRHPDHGLPDALGEPPTTELFVRIAAAANLEALPEDAPSLARWLTRARRILEAARPPP